jgi:hypothetical protein
LPSRRGSLLWRPRGFLGAGRSRMSHSALECQGVTQ